MSQEFISQIRELIKTSDSESLKYILYDEDKKDIEEICSKLTPEQAQTVQKIYNQSNVEGKKVEIAKPRLTAAQKNKKIDEYLLQSKEERQNSKQQSFLQLISKNNEKLIYEQQFGYPYYDLIKRIISTSGDFHPNIQTIKAMHSQMQILYSIMFREDVFKMIRIRYPNQNQGIKGYFDIVFKKEYEQYKNFLAAYKNLKKSTEDQQDSEMYNNQVPLSLDQTLMQDEKLFLVSLTQGIFGDEYHQFFKNKTCSFLCFGMKKYQSFLGFNEKMMQKLKPKQFCELMSFLSIRFVRRTVFEVIRRRGSGKLVQLKQPITSAQIKALGNQIVDRISATIDEFLIPIKSIDDEARQLFLTEFQTMNYSEFIPRKYISQALQNHTDAAEHIWNISKQYKTLWIQRVKAQRYAKDRQKELRPQLDYLDHIERNFQDFKVNSQTLWKNYIMHKFGFEEEKVVTKKRVKMSSLND